MTNVHTETQAEREARWAASAARQEAYRDSPEARQRMADRIAAGKCVVANDWCLTHHVEAGLGHDLDINGTTRPDGTARND